LCPNIISGSGLCSPHLHNERHIRTSHCPRNSPLGSGIHLGIHNTKRHTQTIFVRHIYTSHCPFRSFHSSCGSFPFFLRIFPIHLRILTMGGRFLAAASINRPRSTAVLTIKTQTSNAKNKLKSFQTTKHIQNKHAILHCFSCRGQERTRRS
jgi:hypothetical protein